MTIYDLAYYENVQKYLIEEKEMKLTELKPLILKALTVGPGEESPGTNYDPEKTARRIYIETRLKEIESELKRIGDQIFLLKNKF